MKTIGPTGHVHDRDGTPYLVFERTFRAPIADVWAAVTEPARLERWIGTWTGNPADGRVAFRMTAESADAPEEEILVDECVEPRRLRMRSASYGDPSRLWTWQLELSEADGVTTMTFAQEVTDTVLAESIGPGWDYYLDRLVAAETGVDLTSVVFDDYYPAFVEHYRTELS